MQVDSEEKLADETDTVYMLDETDKDSWFSPFIQFFYLGPFPITPPSLVGTHFCVILHRNKLTQTRAWNDPRTWINSTCATRWRYQSLRKLHLIRHGTFFFGSLAIFQWFLPASLQNLMVKYAKYMHMPICYSDTRHFIGCFSILETDVGAEWQWKWLVVNSL